MKIFSITCTRDKNLSSVTQEMVDTLSSFGVDVKILVNQSSIFEAYKKGLALCKASDKDIIILCHDDIELLDNKEEFIANLSVCSQQYTGIVGPAGTSYLGENAVWWDHPKWEQGYHRGSVQHRKEDGTIYPTEYGRCGQVVALDGLFLAARKEVWKKVGLNKPKYFEGNWDFYDIHYTTTSHLLGYKNCAVPIKIIHHSGGELVGRDSWHKNREAFIHNTKLPLKC
tara:strand:+ start:16 stop:696 length:681 start_codon:yes stop_codon:yes gene_type:complete